MSLNEKEWVEYDCHENCKDPICDKLLENKDLDTKNGLENIISKAMKNVTIEVNE